MDSSADWLTTALLFTASLFPLITAACDYSVGLPQCLQFCVTAQVLSACMSKTFYHARLVGVLGWVPTTHGRPLTEVSPEARLGGC
jgi:hypothetical protein